MTQLEELKGLNDKQVPLISSYQKKIIERSYVNFAQLT